MLWHVLQICNFKATPLLLLLLLQWPCSVVSEKLCKSRIQTRKWPCQVNKCESTAKFCCNENVVARNGRLHCCCCCCGCYCCSSWANHIWPVKYSCICESIYYVVGQHIRLHTHTQAKTYMSICVYASNMVINWLPLLCPRRYYANSFQLICAHFYSNNKKGRELQHFEYVYVLALAQNTVKNFKSFECEYFRS